MFNTKYGFLKNEQITSEKLSELTQSQRCEVMEIIGRGILEYLIRNSLCQATFSKELINPVDGILWFLEQGIGPKPFAFDIKTFVKTDFPRYSYGAWRLDKHTGEKVFWRYNNFQIDKKKLEDITELARKISGRPLLICFFADQLVIWDLDLCDWEKTEHNCNTVKSGMNRTNGTENSKQTYLYMDDAIYRGDIMNINVYYEKIHKNLFS